MFWDSILLNKPWSLTLMYKVHTVITRKHHGSIFTNDLVKHIDVETYVKFTNLCCPSEAQGYFQIRRFKTSPTYFLFLCCCSVKCIEELAIEIHHVDGCIFFAAPCDVNSCAHMCVPLPATYGLESKCLCQDGYNSTDKGKTCRRKSKFSSHIF